MISAFRKSRRRKAIFEEMTEMNKSLNGKGISGMILFFFNSLKNC